MKQEKIDALQKEIDNWNDYIQKVEDSSEIYEREINAQVAKAVWGENWQEQINQDMIDNLDKTVYQACGKLDELIKKYDELYTAQTKITNMTDDEIIAENNLDNSNINELVTDPNSGLTYNKNTDYQAEIKALQQEIARQEKESGTHDTGLDKQIENLNEIRNAKSYNTGAKYGYQAVGSDGKTYGITSDTGKNFVTSAKAGDTITGGDGSTWKKNSDGSISITDTSGNTFTMGAVSKTSSSSSSSSSKSSSSSSSSSKSSSSSSSSYSGVSSSGDSYNIGTDRGKSFINNASAGSTMTGGDGSKWTKNSDGTTTISSGGKTYTVGKKSYATGGVNDEYGFAALHGEHQRAEVIFNAADAKKLWNWINYIVPLYSNI